MGRPAKVKPLGPTFLRQSPHELKKLLASLTRESPGAVTVMSKLLESEDEKIRLQAADKMISMQIEIAELINKDNLQRMVAEVRLNPNGQGLIGAGSTADDSPEVDFDNIQQIN